MIYKNGNDLQNLYLQFFSPLSPASTFDQEIVSKSSRFFKIWVINKKSNDNNTY